MLKLSAVVHFSMDPLAGIPYCEGVGCLQGFDCHEDLDCHSLGVPTFAANGSSVPSVHENVRRFRCKRTRIKQYTALKLL